MEEYVHWDLSLLEKLVNSFIGCYEGSLYYLAGLGLDAWYTSKRVQASSCPNINQSENATNLSFRALSPMLPDSVETLVNLSLYQTRFTILYFTTQQNHESTRKSDVSGKDTFCAGNISPWVALTFLAGYSIYTM